MKKYLFNLLIVLSVMFLMTSCLTTKQTNLLKESKGETFYNSLEYQMERYQVKVGDQLNISLKFNAFDKQTSQLFSYFSSQQGGTSNNESRLFPISVDGTIYFPYIGEVYVRGKNTWEIQQILEKRIHENITEDCFVKISLGNRFYSVIGMGGVGQYTMPKEKMTIFQALAQSKDIKPYGDRKHVKIIRETEEGTIVKTFDLRYQDVVNSEFYYIEPNDIIYIQPLGRQFLGINSFGAVFALISTVISFGLLIYRATTSF